MEKPRAIVAIIMRTKNRPVLLRRAFESVVGQTYKKWHLVVVNDGGDISQVKALQQKFNSLLNDRITIVHHLVSKGMEAASNAGINAIDSDYVIIHDDDDSWQPEFLETAVAALEATPPEQNVGGVLTYIARITERIEEEKIIETAREDCSHWLDDISLWRMAAGNNFPPISFLYKRAAMEKIGGYDERLPVLGDWEFNLRFLKQFEIMIVPRMLANYHHRETSVEGEYQSTFVGQQDKHQIINRMLRNEKLRDDLTSGRFGEGLMLSMANQIRMSKEQLEQVIYQQTRLMDINMNGLFRILHQHIDNQIQASNEHIHQSLAQLHKSIGQVMEGQARQNSMVRPFYNGIMRIASPLLKLRTMLKGLKK